MSEEIRCKRLDADQFGFPWLESHRHRDRALREHFSAHGRVAQQQSHGAHAMGRVIGDKE